MPQGTYEVEGGEEVAALAARLRRYPEIVVEEVAPTFRRIVIRLADAIAQQTPVYRARLKTAIQGSPRVEVQGNEVIGMVSAMDIPYALDMEIGPPSGVEPDMEELRKWAGRVLGDEERAGDVAVALYEGRSAVQQRPYGMFAKGWQATIGFARVELRGMVKRILARLAGKG